MILNIAKTALSLGLLNIMRFFSYQLGIKLGLNPVIKLKSDMSCGEFFTFDYETDGRLKPNKQWIDKHCLFGLTKLNTGTPEWHKNCFTGKIAAKNKPWFSISDFDSELGDIKGVWEVSRFDWVISFAQHGKTGNSPILEQLNRWLNDWVLHNPAYMGVNWKCGQEASIRIMHLAVAAHILQQTRSTSSVLQALIKTHLKRISPTIMYAISQDNNHGTSEAAALFIGGSWLAMNGDPDGLKWQNKGVKWLENRAKKLIENDGSFSQYSVNYHRAMLDTYSLVEVWRQKHSLPLFSKQLYEKISLASYWLHYFTCEVSGDAPNIGANDGVRLIPLTNSDYRDFKPSVQLANALFNKSKAYTDSGLHNLALDWLGVELPKRELEPKNNRDFPLGGYCFMRRGKLSLYLNYPNFKFRPSQCDALHIDLWLNGVNIFRDGGTFSYNAGEDYINYYTGAQSHNTVQFDSHQQMPRLSRFLLGGWLKLSNKQSLTSINETDYFSVSYYDRFNCFHQREIQLTSNKLVVKDKLSNIKKSAVSRFRLAPIQWRLEANTLISEHCSIIISSTVPIKRMELTQGKESRYYFHESDIPVLEIEVRESGAIITEINY